MSITWENDIAPQVECVFSGAKKTLNWDAFIQSACGIPFAADTVGFCEELSRRLLTEKRCAAFPDLTALGFWFRTARLKKLQSQFATSEDVIAVAKGLVFHIAPGNVDTIFAYSMLLSMLAGNSNVIRLGQKHTPQQDLLLELLAETLHNYPRLAERTLMVRYPHDDIITAFFSVACHLRVIWGGDDTINHIRKIPIPAGSGELTFSGKFSFAVIDIEQWLQTPSAKKFAAAFLTDAFSFGQQGCSSPKLICWCGEHKLLSAAQKSFWSAVDELLAQTPNQLSASESMRRWLAVNATAIESSTSVKLIPSTDKTSYVRLQLEGWDSLVREINTGNGIFYEMHCENLVDVLQHCTDQDQTVVSFGVSTKDWRQALLAQPPKGLCRIVPMGRALEFHAVWDGIDLLNAMSKKIVLWS